MTSVNINHITSIDASNKRVNLLDGSHYLVYDIVELNSIKSKFNYNIKVKRARDKSIIFFCVLMPLILLMFINN